MMPRRVIDVLDAVSGARRMARNELAQEILAKWAEEQIHTAMVIQRVVKLNPPPMDSFGKVIPSVRSIDTA